MRASSIVLIVIMLLACNSEIEIKKNNSIHSNEIKIVPDCNVALKFINDYAEFCSPKTPLISDTNWIENNVLLTDNFKTRYKNLLDSADKIDSELGLDFDPIFEAQDFPDKGFELINCDNETGYVTVRGKDWKNFVLVLKLGLQGNKWLVDGSGVINIPVNKRAKR